MDGLKIKDKGELKVSKKPAIRITVFAVLAAVLVTLASCKTREEPAQEKKAAEPAAATFIIAEKTLMDAPNRNSVSMKIIVTVPGKPAVEQALKQAMEDIKKTDPSIKSMLIFAYNKREEHNSDYTAGRLEWSEDGKNYSGNKPLSPNPKIDNIRQ